MNLSTNDLKRELDMDARTIDKLIADSESDPWRLKRAALHRLCLFAHSHGVDAFRIEPHPIWKGFENSEALLFRGPKKSDIPVEDHLVKYFERLTCEVNSSTSFSGLDEKMREHNCVIIGSPKANRASELALTLLWGAEPFDSSAKNREKIPISFLGMQTDSKEPSALLQEGTRHGLSILPSGAKEKSFLKADWLPPEKFGPYKGTGQDAAVLVVCNRPLGTKNDVTTVVIAGYTGLATLVAAQEATYKEIPDLQPHETPGEPVFAALKFRYKKRIQYKRMLDNLRTLEEGSTKWAPPWHAAFFL
ncbi:MAG TPA: hypothetical protein VF173_01430 [Thermoanaerobaculia bacterium]|nr:hypothetical protein [Thermoanaerobaculia bacterium]